METIPREQFDRMIDRHFRFEAEDDVEGVLSTMVPDVEHDVVGSPTGPLHGKQQARGFYDALFADLSGEKVLGWVSMTLFALIGTAHPAVTEGRMATAQFWLHN